MYGAHDKAPFPHTCAAHAPWSDSSNFLSYLFGRHWRRDRLEVVPRFLALVQQVAACESSVGNGQYLSGHASRLTNNVSARLKFVKRMRRDMFGIQQILRIIAIDSRHVKRFVRTRESGVLPDILVQTVLSQGAQQQKPSEGQHMYLRITYLS